MIRLILSGVLALPVILWTICTVPLVMIMSIPPCFLLLIKKKKTRNKEVAQPTRRQVIVTGGSSGIGLAIGKLAAQRNDVVRVVLLARTESKLKAAADEINKCVSNNNNSTSIETYVLDVSDPQAVETLVADIMKKDRSGSSGGVGSIDLITHVFCCAAANSNPNYLHETPPEVFSTLVQTNQLGTMYVSNAFLKHMKSGTIQLCSSMAGQVGIFGLAAYSPTKFALRGYAEAVHMELTHRSDQDVHIQLAFPPDTDTPGYALENESKPVETALICETAGLLSAEFVASVMLQEAVADHPKFQIYFTFDGFLLCTLTAGFGPVVTLWDAVCQVSLLTLTRWVALLYLNDWHRMLGNEQEKKLNSKPVSSTNKKED